MRMMLIAVLMLGGAPALAAQCPSVPDDAASHYVANGAARAFCLERQLAADTALRNQLTTLQTQVQAIEADALQRQLAPPPMPVFTVPSVGLWP